MTRTARVVAPLLLLAVACGGGDDGGVSARWRRFDPGPTPVELRRGEVLFNSYCMSCHGRHGKGEGLGPPLLDSLFAPSRVADDAAVRAVEQGSKQTNFNFGAMPPVPRLTRPETELVIAYVRWVQQRAWGAAALHEPDSMGR